MPRHRPKVVLAPRDRLAAVESLAPRFFTHVVGCEYAECLVTDESELRDFADVFGDRGAEIAAMLDRLEAHYAVDGRAAGSTRIVDLLEYLRAQGVGACDAPPWEA